VFLLSPKLLPLNIIAWLLSRKPSFLSDSEWSKKLCEAWCLHKQDEEATYLQKLSPLEIKVDLEWKQYMNLLSKVYQTATKISASLIAAPENEKELKHKLDQTGRKNGKGTAAPKFQKVNQTIHNSGHQLSSQSVLKYARRLARLYELQRLIHKDVNNQRHLLNECRENTRNLFRKLWKAEATPRDLSLANILHKIKRDIQDTNADRLRQEHDNTQLRLRQWKARYQTGNITAISKWIQRKEQKSCPSQCYS